MATVLPDVQSANPGFIFETLLAYQRTAALRTAIEINLFGALGDGPARAADLAARCGVSERGARILCNYLTTIGLVEKDGIPIIIPLPARSSWIRAPLPAWHRFSACSGILTFFAPGSS